MLGSCLSMPSRNLARQCWNIRVKNECLKCYHTALDHVNMVWYGQCRKTFCLTANHHGQRRVLQDIGSKLDKELFKRCQLSTSRSMAESKRGRDSFFSGSSTVVRYYRSTLCTCVFAKSASSFELSRISPSSSSGLHLPSCSKANARRQG